MPKNSSEVPRSRSKTRTPTEAPQATKSGAMSRALGQFILRNVRPAAVNSSRFETRKDAKKIISRIFANSPGWMEKPPGNRNQIFAPLTVGAIEENGMIPGSASATNPTRPQV